MSPTSIIRPIRTEEAAEAKQLVFQVAHELMEPEMPLKDFMTLWHSWGVVNDMDDVQRD